jgi:hypothetical protein
VVKWIKAVIRRVFQSSSLVPSAMSGPIGLQIEFTLSAEVTCSKIDEFIAILQGQVLIAHSDTPSRKEKMKLNLGSVSLYCNEFIARFSPEAKR